MQTILLTQPPARIPPHLIRPAYSRRRTRRTTHFARTRGAPDAPNTAHPCTTRKTTAYSADDIVSTARVRAPAHRLLGKSPGRWKLNNSGGGTRVFLGALDTSCGLGWIRWMRQRCVGRCRVRRPCAGAGGHVQVRRPRGAVSADRRSRYADTQ